VEVIRELASVKLSGSLKINEYWKLININMIKNKINPYKFFISKIDIKGIL